MLILLPLTSLLLTITFGYPIQDTDYDYGKMTESIFYPLKLEVIHKTIKHDSLGRPDNKVGETLDLWRPGSGPNPEELGSYHEGDLLTIKHSNNTAYLWDHAIVPYVISGNFSEFERNMIMGAMSEFHTRTCIKFKPYVTQKQVQSDYINITSEKTGCWSSVGREGGGGQQLNLQTPGCVYYMGTVMHELNHAIGFYHIHTRPDRNEYVTIHTENIKEGAKENFEVEIANAFDTRYDYDSIMHFSAYAFSKNNEKTIVPKQNEAIGQRNKLSTTDIAKIQAVYKCRGQESRL